MFHLEVGLVQGFKGTSVVEVVVEWDGEVGVCDGGDKGCVFGGRWEQAEAVTMDRDVDREDGGNFYSRQRRRSNYGGRERQRGWCGELRTTRWWGVLRKPELSTFCGEEEAGSPPRGGNIGQKGIRRGGMRGQGCNGCQGWRAHDFRMELRVGEEG